MNKKNHLFAKFLGSCEQKKCIINHVVLFSVRLQCGAECVVIEDGDDFDGGEDGSGPAEHLASQADDWHSAMEVQTFAGAKGSKFEGYGTTKAHMSHPSLATFPFLKIDGYH